MFLQSVLFNPLKVPVGKITCRWELYKYCIRFEADFVVYSTWLMASIWYLISFSSTFLILLRFICHHRNCTCVCFTCSCQQQAGKQGTPKLPSQRTTSPVLKATGLFCIWAPKHEVKTILRIWNKNKYVQLTFLRWLRYVRHLSLVMWIGIGVLEEVIGMWFKKKKRTQENSWKSFLAE